MTNFDLYCLSIYCKHKQNIKKINKLTEKNIKITYIKKYDITRIEFSNVVNFNEISSKLNEEKLEIIPLYSYEECQCCKCEKLEIECDGCAWCTCELNHKNDCNISFSKCIKNRKYNIYSYEILNHYIQEYYCNFDNENNIKDKKYFIIDCSKYKDQERNIEHICNNFLNDIIEIYCFNYLNNYGLIKIKKEINIKYASERFKIVGLKSIETNSRSLLNTFVFLLNKNKYLENGLDLAFNNINKNYNHITELYDFCNNQINEIKKIDDKIEKIDNKIIELDQKINALAMINKKIYNEIENLKNSIVNQNNKKNKNKK